MVDEAHITTFAVHPAWRRQRHRGAAAPRLPRHRHRPRRPRGDARGPAVQPAGAPAVREVRLPAGRPASALLQRRPRGRADHDHRAARRARDARAASSGCARRSTRRRRRTRARMPARGDAGVSGPLLLSIESSCDETGIALIEGGRRILSQRRRVAGRAARRRPAGSCPRSPRGPTCAGSCPTLDEAWADAGRRLARRRRDRRHLRAGAGRLAAGRDQLREGARLGPRQAAHRRQPPRGPRLRGLAARSGRGRGDQGRAGLPARRARRVGRPHVPRRDARPPDLPAARARPSTTPPARRSTRSAGCSGLGYPGGPAIQKAAEGAIRPRRALPAGLDGRLVRLELLGAQDRGPADRRRRPGRRGAAGRRRRRAAVRGDRPRSWPGASRTRSSTCSRPRPSGPPREVGARSIVLGGGVAANSVPARAAGAARPTAWACRSSCPRPGLCTDNGAMIGAAGARRFAAGERAAARPRRPAVAAAGRRR